MYERSQLGIAPAVVALIAQQAPTILSNIDKSVFGDQGSYPQTHAAIRQWVAMILADPAGAVSGNYIRGPNYQTNAAGAYLSLRCWAGDQSILPIYRQVSGDPAANGCGCETFFGCRADAQNALREVDAALNQAVPVTSSADIPSQGPQQYGGTVYTPLPGGGSIGLPIGGGTLLTASIGGIPIWALGAGLALFAFAGGSRRREG